MLDNRRIGGLLLMGGTGLRFGSPTPKQFHRLAGKPVFLHTLEALLSSQLFDEIVLSCHPDWLEFTKNQLPCSSLIQLVAGGRSRQESSYKGLIAFRHPPDIVLIHDAVRPFISRHILLKNIEQALLTSAVDTCIPTMDTLVHSPDSQTIAAIPPRAEFLRGQTPQTFSYPLIVTAHEQTKRRDASDDCQLVRDLGHAVHVVPGHETNIKITTELDLILAEQILRLHIDSPPPLSLSSLTGRKIALIGGTGGIGQAISRKLHALGAHPLSLSRTTTPALDLSDPSSILQAFQFIENTIGPLDGLINAAGRLFVNPLQHLSLREIQETLDVNLRGPILCCKIARFHPGAHVINIASSSFSRGRKEQTLYSSSKAGLVNFTQGWAEERPDLRIHAVIPQRANTAMRRDCFPKELPSTLLDPDQVADAVINLLLNPDLTGLLVEVRKNDPFSCK